MSSHVVALPDNASPPSHQLDARLFAPGAYELVTKLLAEQWDADAEAAARYASTQVFEQSLGGGKLTAQPSLGSDITSVDATRCDSPVRISSDDESPATAALGKRKTSRPISKLHPPKPPVASTAVTPGLLAAPTMPAARGRGRSRGATKDAKAPPPIANVKALRKHFPTIGDYARNLSCTPRADTARTMVESSDENVTSQSPTTSQSTSEHRAAKKRRFDEARNLDDVRVLFVSDNGTFSTVGTKKIMDVLYSRGATIHEAYISPADDPDGHTTHIVATREGESRLKMGAILRSIGLRRSRELFGATASLPMHMQRPWVIDQGWASSILRDLYDPEAGHLIDRKQSTREVRLQSL
jgi:hypothetical protein